MWRTDMNWSETAVGATGAGGFLGTHLCERLVDEGASVRAIDNFYNGSQENIDEIRDDITTITADIRNADEETFQGLDVVFHFAAIANPRTCQSNRDLAFDINVEGTRKVFEACNDANVERVVFFSSAAVYGAPQKLPIAETHSLNGRDPYAMSKKIGEDLSEMYHEQTEIDVFIVRNFNIFGPRQTEDYLIPTLVTQADDDEEIEIWTADSARDFTYVEDAVDAFMAIADTSGLAGEPVNVGSNMEVGSRELADRIAEEFGGVSVVNLDKDNVDESRLVCDNTKLRETTDWKPSVGFDRGLARTIDWYLSQ